MLFRGADVLDHPEQRAVGELRRDHFRFEDRAILAAKAPFASMAGRATDFSQRLRNVSRFGFDQDVGGVQSDQLVARITEHLADAFVCVDVIALRIGVDDADRRLLEERAIARIAHRAPTSFSPSTSRTLRASASGV